MDTSRGYEFLTDCPTCLTGFHEVAYPGICECKLHGHKTARRNWKGKSYADVSLDRVNVLSIYALHLTTNDYISIYIYTYIYIYKYIPWQPKRKVANVWNEVHNQVPACLGCTNTWFLTVFDSCSYSFGNHLKAHSFVMESYSHQTSTHERVAVTKIKTCINNK